MPVTEEELRHAAALLRAGQLVAFPTETVYGLGANALDPVAVAGIFTAKGRPRTSPLIVHVASVAMARQVVSAWPDAAARLAERYWPGPLTLVLPKQSHIPDEVTAGLPTVGIRIPDHPVALALIEAAGVPVAAPSANPFTGLSPVTAEHVRLGLGSSIMVLDGGPARVGIESTVLSLAGVHPALLRPGMISQSEIESLIGAVRSGLRGGEEIENSGAHASPGMHLRHYQPRTRLRLGKNAGPDSAWVYWGEPNSGAGKQLRLPTTPSEYARQLYATLHLLDAENWGEIVVEPPPDTPEWAGLTDRLQRAAGGARDRVFQEEQDSRS